MLINPLLNGPFLHGNPTLIRLVHAAYGQFRHNTHAIPHSSAVRRGVTSQSDLCSIFVVSMLYITPYFVLLGRVIARHEVSFGKAVNSRVVCPTSVRFAALFVLEIR